MAKKKPIIDPLAGTMGELLAKPRGTTDTIVNPTVASTISPTDTLATVDPLARYTDAIRNKTGKEQERYKDKLPGFTTAEFPDWTPQDLEALYRTSKDFDNRFYNESDQRFARDHPGLRLAEKEFESRVHQEQSGDFRLAPAVRDAFLTTGLEGALGAFGDTPGTIRRGSAAEAAIGRSLAGPQGILGFQDRNRRNALESLTLAETLFPHRQVGFSGEAATQIAMGNVDNQNVYDFAKYTDVVGKDLFNWNINTSNIQQAIEQRNAAAQAIADRQNAAATTAAGDKASKTATRNAAIGAGAAILGAVVIAF